MAPLSCGVSADLALFARQARKGSADVDLKSFKMKWLVEPNIGDNGRVQAGIFLNQTRRQRPGSSWQFKKWLNHPTDSHPPLLIIAGSRAQEASWDGSSS